MLATDRVALGECADAARGGAPDLCPRSRDARASLPRQGVDIDCASYAVPPAAVTLDVDDTVDVVHGHQQLALFNAHYDERCFLPIHIYEARSGKPVAAILRPGKTPGGTEVRTVVRHVVRRIRRHWPKVAILLRGDSHYARPQAMDWCEANRVDYVLGLAGNAVLQVYEEAPLKPSA